MSPFIINASLFFFTLAFVILVGFAFKYAYDVITEKSVEERQREAVSGYGKKNQATSNFNYRR
jgi:F0F1-type ATP synthase membrane subunit b/b'